MAHPEWNYADPRIPVVGIEGHLLGNKRSDRVGRHRPVGEEQFVPCLLHDPRAGGQRIGSMLDGLQQGMHLTFYPWRISSPNFLSPYRQVSASPNTASTDAITKLWHPCWWGSRTTRQRGSVNMRVKKQIINVASKVHQAQRWPRRRGKDRHCDAGDDH